MRVLVVEDSATVRHAMSSYVASAGHEVIVAQDGEHALQIVESTPVDLIFMDIQMPGLDGFETTRLIREGLGDFWVPIIFVTGDKNENSYEEGIEAGGDDYLIKPVSEIILNAKIQAMERIVAMRNQLTTLNRELLEVSQKDGLTGLYNRRTFDEKALYQWRLAARNKEPMAVLIMDIDHFKLYNDTYGHPEGDKCICKVTEVLRACVSRPGDLLARYGGEEFIALLPHTPEEGVRHICDELRQTLFDLNIKHRTSTTSDRITISIGASMMNYTTGTTLNEQIKYADLALYQSKSRGRDCATLKMYQPHRKVLVIDDDTKNLEQISAALDGHCSVNINRYQEDWLSQALELKPDVLVLDIDGPGSPGLKYCQQSRNKANNYTTPMIFMSTAEKDVLLELGKKSGARALLQKPVDKHRLIAKVNELLT